MQKFYDLIKVAKDLNNIDENLINCFKILILGDIIIKY